MVIYHNMVKKILYTYVYHIIGYLENCEALHEITDLVHEMLNVCAPLVDCYARESGFDPHHNQAWEIPYKSSALLNC